MTDAQHATTKLSMTPEEMVEFMGEGFHTAFRKVGDSIESNEIWKLIDEMPPEEWTRILRFVAEPLYDALTMPQ